MPGSCQHLALCSKAWSDVTYMDEIQGRFREKLTTQMKRDVNEKAIKYSIQVPNHTWLQTRCVSAKLAARKAAWGGCRRSRPILRPACRMWLLASAWAV